MKRPLLPVVACLTLVAATACEPSAQPSGADNGPSNVTVATPAAAPSATPSGGATPAPSATYQAATPTQTPRANAQPSGNQEVTVNALQGEPDNIDPDRAYFAGEGAVVRQVFESLLTFDKDLTPSPGAASSYEVSQDGTTYTFHLKQGGMYSDGKPVKAQDFEYSFKRLLDPRTAAEYASLFTDAGIVGAAEFNSGRGNVDSVGVKATDDNTLQIQLRRPVGYFPDLVALPVVAPLRQDIVQKNDDGWSRDPSTYIGNGPFKMTEWVHQDHITFVPNPNYVGAKPTLQKMTFLMVGDGEADYAAYRNNERDWALVPDADVKAVRSDPQLSSQLVDYTELSTFWLIMNNARPPLDNVNVRRALSKAIDRNALIRDVASGVGKPAASMIPPGMPGHQPDLGKDIDFDPAGAKQLLAQAGYGDPSTFPQIHLRYANSSSNQSRVEFIQAQFMENLGITIILDPIGPKAYQATYRDKDYELAWGGWSADYPDPQNWMASLFGCNASNNKYNYCNPLFDQASMKGDTASDANQRMQAYAQAQQILVADVPVAPLIYRGRMVLVKPWVQNLAITPKDDYPGVSFLPRVFVTPH